MQFSKITIVTFSSLVTSVFAHANANFYHDPSCLDFLNSDLQVGDGRCRSHPPMEGMIITSEDPSCTGKLAMLLVLVLLFEKLADMIDIVTLYSDSDCTDDAITLDVGNCVAGMGSFSVDC
jgi:hypothetical protein